MHVRALLLALCLPMIAACGPAPLVPPPTAAPPPAILPTPSSAPAPCQEPCETFTSLAGYRIRYPSRLVLDQPVPGLYVLLQEAGQPASYIFSMDERGTGTLEQMREAALANLVDPHFTQLSVPGMEGFWVRGTLGPGYGQGSAVQSAYVQVQDKLIAFGCQVNLCKLDLFEQILDALEATNPG